jgi:hypothetical protein
MMRLPWFGSSRVPGQCTPRADSTSRVLGVRVMEAVLMRAWRGVETACRDPAQPARTAEDALAAVGRREPCWVHTVLATTAGGHQGGALVLARRGVWSVTRDRLG